MIQNLLESCTGCYTITLSDCVDQITVDAGLTPNTNYVYRITDKFSNRYYESVTTDGEGKFIVTAPNRPSGLFTPYSGILLLQVFENRGSCEPLSLTLCGETYNCVQMNFQKTTSTDDANEARISCCACQTSITVNSHSYDCQAHVLHINFTNRCFERDDLIFDMVVIDSNNIPVAHNYVGGPSASNGTHDDVIANWFSLPGTPPANGSYRLLITLKDHTLTVFTNPDYLFEINCP